MYLDPAELFMFCGTDNTLTVVLDPSDMVQETNEDNNRAVISNVEMVDGDENYCTGHSESETFHVPGKMANFLHQVMFS